MGVAGTSTVVIGGGVAGLLAAQALTETFDTVSIVERDHVGLVPAHRGGVPQDKHVHTLWAGGMRAMESLLPGLEQQLLEAGGQAMDFWSEFRWLLPSGHWFGRWPPAQRLVMSSRVLLEHTIRAAIVAGGRVRLLEGHEVTGLRLDAGGAVAGVRVAPRRGGSDLELSAGLVVDAAGRRSGLPDWLAALDLARPTERVIDPLVGYATRLFVIPTAQRPDFKGLYVQLAPPGNTRGGIMFPIEDGRWVVTLLGACRDYPSTDEAEYLQFARSLRSGELYDVIKGAEPASPVWGHRHTANRRRYFERLTSMPTGLLVMGDSLCAFNPIYGQGMTVAAMQAEALRKLARTVVRTARDAPMLGRSAQRPMARIANQAWLVSANQDLRYPVTGGPGRAVRLLHGLMDRVTLASTVDETVANTFLRVLNMMDGPQSLLTPGMLIRVLRGAHRAGASPRLHVDVEPSPEDSERT